MLNKHYDPKEAEPRWMAHWQEKAVYHFPSHQPGPVFSIDTPPPSVSGHLHLGHTYSYSHPDFIARYWRMKGWRVFYPMGFDDNGLPTERLVEKSLGLSAVQVGRQAFIEKCLQISEQAEADYKRLWQHLGLSIDWRYTYRTIDHNSRRICQFSFIDLYQKDLAYRQQAPAIWCPECQTSIAQAELNDLERQSDMITLIFKTEQGENFPIASTRPELLSACVAVFVHPHDSRFLGLIGKRLQVPFYNQWVDVLADPGTDPEKGTGAVMCCTFGDSADLQWWRSHQLRLIQAIGADGRMTSDAGFLSGMKVVEARKAIIAALEAQNLATARHPTLQSVRVHERCDTPIEYILTLQWFIRLLENKEQFLRAGDQIAWEPEHMRSRYRAWVESLNWDWCISRQRYFGVPFPLWYCEDCGAITLADPDQLPVDPSTQLPDKACQCGSRKFIPEADVFDTWMTSSLTPQIVGQWIKGMVDLPGESMEFQPQSMASPGQLYEQVFPFSLRPQAHEIIRTWAFYTIVKSIYHFNELPWKKVLISGWGIAGEGKEKISKSRGGGPLPPLEMIGRYSADALRYWAASTSPGKDAVISEEKIQLGARLITKIWNVARFSERFLAGYNPGEINISLLQFTSGDRWILSSLQTLINRASDSLQRGEYAYAKSELELFFWHSLADNYLEMCKQRLYQPDHIGFEAARFSLYQVLLNIIKMFALYFPFITEEIYMALFAESDPTPDHHQQVVSVHTASWPAPDSRFTNPEASRQGELLVEIASAVRRYKSENNLPLGSELTRLQLAPANNEIRMWLVRAQPDLISISRAREIEITDSIDPKAYKLSINEEIYIGIFERS